ncbi:DUF2785 domain-containing protein [Nocardioides sp. DS6]|uniref:DUF2785 domain-containing protein n=1 Tax=Nocardioides eburneus TaxID=3231482 RepID=A0ABV3T2Q6_9ACTN
MSGSYWEEVHATGLAVPSDRPLDELTAELTRMLGDPDPQLRDALAYPTLTTWIARGVYDDLLSGLGDGMAAGLTVDLGETDTDTVFRRSFSALVLGACIARDNSRPLVAGGKILEWGDRIATWLLRERDLRGFVPGKGWAHAMAHGADALGSLAASPHLSTPELTVVLDVVADRILARSDTVLVHGEPDRLASATVAVLRRNLVPLSVLEPWVNRIGAVAATPSTAAGRDPYLVTANAESFLRALYLQLALGTRQPEVRHDLLLVIVDALKRSNVQHLGYSGPSRRTDLAPPPL